MTHVTLLDLSRLSHLAAAKTGYRTWSSSRKVDKRRSVVQRKTMVVETCKGGAKPFPLTQVFWKNDQISQAVNSFRLVSWALKTDHQDWPMKLMLPIQWVQWDWVLNASKHRLMVSRWKVCFGTASHPSCWIWDWVFLSEIWTTWLNASWSSTIDLECFEICGAKSTISTLELNTTQQTCHQGCRAIQATCNETFIWYQVWPLQEQSPNHSGRFNIWRDLDDSMMKQTIKREIKFISRLGILGFQVSSLTSWWPTGLIGDH